MKRLDFKIIIVAIKTLCIAFLVGLFCFFALALKTKETADDLWKQLGLTQFEANKNMQNSFLYGRFLYLGAKNAKNIVSGDRVAVINDLAVYAKKYSASEEFRREYENFRTRNKPVEPVMIQLSVDSIRGVEKERIEKAIKQTEANANSPNEKLRNSVPLRLENLRKELSALQDPNNKTIKLKLDNAQRSHEYAVKLYKDALIKFEMEYPKNPDLLIKKRLHEILNITADVDYNAELKEVNNKKLFVNPAYEAKPREWKLAFRVGKPGVDAIRAIAQKWLQELIDQGEKKSS